MEGRYLIGGGHLGHGHDRTLHSVIEWPFTVTFTSSSYSILVTLDINLVTPRVSSIALYLDFDGYTNLGK